MARITLQSWSGILSNTRRILNNMFAELYSRISIIETNERVDYDIAVTNAGTVITFSSDLSSIDYAIEIRCFKANGDNVDFSLTNKTINGFTLTSVENAFIDYIAKIKI